MESICKRLDKLEIQEKEEALTLVEILSNATFFGEIKKAKCRHSRNGQCGFFILEDQTRYELPIVTACRIKNCRESAAHSHIEISNITCSLCQENDSGQEGFGYKSNSISESGKWPKETETRREE